MSAAPSGWANNLAVNSGIATGTTTITFFPPTDLADDDIMVVAFGHKGSGFATGPAGWTAKVQVLEATSGLRGEVWWKRAAAEAGNYTFTGLATTASGTIRNYKGGILIGDPFDVTSSRANASSAATGTAAMTTTVDNALLISIIFAAENTGPFGAGGGDAAHLDVASLALVEAIGTTGSYCAYADTILPVAGLTSAFDWFYFPSGTGQNIGVALALMPQTGVATTETNYYLSLTYPGSRNWTDGYLSGSWTRSADAPATIGVPGGFDTYELSQIKARGGGINDMTVTTDQPGDSILRTRFVTPRLTAQTINGTMDLNFLISASMNDNATYPLNSFKVNYKVHAYISVGDTPVVRHTLLNNYVDGADWPVAEIRQGFAAPQALSAGNTLDGDRVVIEFGIFIRVLPTVPPTYPPTLWGGAFIRGFGTQYRPGAFDTTLGVPRADGVLGTNAGTPGVAYFTFSHVFVEKALPTAPANTSLGSATVIAATPYVEAAYDNTGAGVPGQQTWYSLTPATTVRHFFYLLGSSWGGFIDVFEADGTTPVAAVDEGGGTTWNRNDYMYVADLTAGQTYTIRVANRIQGLGANGAPLAPSRPGGGVTRLGVSTYSAPQENDLYVPAATIYALRNGVIVNMTQAWRNYSPTGINLDFSGVPIPDFNSPSWPLPTNTDPKVYLNLFSLGFVVILDGLSLNCGEAECNDIIDVLDPFNATPPDTGPFGLATIDIVDGKLLIGCFGDGFFLVNGADNNSLAAFYNTIASNQYYGAIRETSAYATDDQGPFPFATPYDAAVEKCAAWHIRVNPADHDQIYYVSGGDYVEQSQINSVVVSTRATLIKRFSRTTGQLTNFASVPLASGVHEGLYGIDINPNGDVLVCNGPQVDRLNSAGSVVQSYVPSDPDKSTSLIAVRYTSTGEEFWVFDQASGTLWQFRISDGAELQQIDWFPWSYVTQQMAIWLPSGITPPPPECPGLVTVPRTDGLPYVPFTPS